MVMVILSTAGGANAKLQCIIMAVCSGYITYLGVMSVRSAATTGGPVKLLLLNMQTGAHGRWLHQCMHALQSAQEQRTPLPHS